MSQVDRININIIDATNTTWIINASIDDTMYDVLLKGQKKYNLSGCQKTIYNYSKNVIRKNIIDSGKKLIPMKQPIKNLFDTKKSIILFC